MTVVLTDTTTTMQLLLRQSGTSPVKEPTLSLSLSCRYIAVMYPCIGIGLVVVVVFVCFPFFERGDIF